MCWNGPQRSVQVGFGKLSNGRLILICVWQVDLSCGLSNELLTVAEREKCEYLITGTTPALCSSEFEGSLRDEL